MDFISPANNYPKKTCTLTIYFDTTFWWGFPTRHKLLCMTFLFSLVRSFISFITDI